MQPQASMPSESATPQNPYSRRKRKKTSITGTYLLMHSVHSKLSQEASKEKCDLRMLVGHANLLDSLIMNLNNNNIETETLPDQTTKPGTIMQQNHNHDTASSSYVKPETSGNNSDSEDGSHCDIDSFSDSDSDSDSEISWSSSESDSSSDSESNRAIMEHLYYLPGIHAGSKTSLLKLNLEASRDDG